MTDQLGDMMQGAPAAGGPAPADDAGKYKDDPLYQMMTGVEPSGSAPAPEAPAPGPAAPAAPPKPRALARLPPPAPTQPGAPPGAIVDAKEDLSPGAVWGGAEQSAAGSFLNQIGQTVKPFLDWKGDAALGHTLLTNPGAVGKAIGDVYGPRYDLLHPYREGGILQTLKHDPFAPLSDAAAVGSVLTGGELLAPKLAGAAGDVANIVGKVGKASQYLDPAYAAAKVASAPARLVLGSPGAARGVGSAIGRAGGVAAGLAIPAPGAHLVTGFAGEHIGGELGGWVGSKLQRAAQNPIVRQGVKTAAGVIPAATVASGLAPMSPGEQAQTPSGQGAAAPGAGQPGGGAGPALDPRYANDPLYQMMMGGSPSSAAGGPSAGAPPGPSAGLQGQPPPTPRGAMFGHIADIAANAGANPTEISTLQQIARIESSGNPSAASPSGRYHGLFQYQDSQGAEADTVRALGDLKNNEQRLTRMGVTPDAGALYIMHQQGAGGGPALLTAAPGTSAIDAISRFYGSRSVARQAIAHNLGINYRTPQGEAQANAAAENMTAADFVNLWRNKLTGVPFAHGGRARFAAGGNVVDMTERLLQRAEGAQKAAQASTKPLLGLSDDTVAQALRVAQRGL